MAAQGALALRKHPHVRGEDEWRLPTANHPKETPPRAWGRRAVGFGVALGLGNTPTCVGKTPGWRDNCKGLSKHPHVRGEDAFNGKVSDRDFETPPRAWGRRKFIVQRLHSLGNTPTCVGKTIHPATAA